MKSVFTKVVNKKYGILLMVISLFLTIIMLLNLPWRADLTFMQNLSYGYIFKLEDFFEHNCVFQNGFKISCDTEHLYFYLKYLMVIPMLTFLLGLLGYLNESKK